MQAPNTATKVVTVVLIILMSATTFTTQRQLMTKNMPASALDNPFAKQQKVLLYVLPLVFAVSGVNFPIGVLIYWFTTNVWSMCQQFYVIRRMPAPGSAAEKAYHARLERKGKPIPGCRGRQGQGGRRGRGGRRAGQAVGPAPAAGLEEAQEEQGRAARSRPAGSTAAGNTAAARTHPAAPRRATARARRPTAEERRRHHRQPARRQEGRQERRHAAPSPPRPDPPDRRRTT